MQSVLLAAAAACEGRVECSAVVRSDRGKLRVVRQLQIASSAFFR